MILHTKRRRLAPALRDALIMCNWQGKRMCNGVKPFTVAQLAKRYAVCERTVFRWIAVATEAGVLKLTRTGRLPRWKVNSERIVELRTGAGSTYGRNRPRRYSDQALKARFGYREGVFAHYGCPSKATPRPADLTTFAPHTPYVSPQRGCFMGIESLILPSFPISPRVRAREGVPSSQDIAAAVMLRLAAGASVGGKRAAARALATSGLFSGSDGGALRVHEARRVLGHKPLNRANGSDSERSATVLQKERVK